MTTCWQKYRRSIAERSIERYNLGDFSFIKEINKKFGKSRVVFTGGDAKYFVNYFKTMIFADSNLILVGLNEILKNYEEN